LFLAFSETLGKSANTEAITLNIKASDTPIEVWCQDEMRVGQKNKLTYRWARKGQRPRAAHDQRTQSTYLFGAVCPERGAGAALVLTTPNSADNSWPAPDHRA
jgi:hypothetical protein